MERSKTTKDHDKELNDVRSNIRNQRQEIKTNILKMRDQTQDQTQDRTQDQRKQKIESKSS